MPEKIRENTEEAIPKEQSIEYGFEFMEYMEPAMISLVEQLKDKIESGEYGALLSDEIGGRIPTLVLRKIMKEKGPKNQDGELKTYFLSAGYYMPDRDEQEYKKYKEYIKGLDFGDKKILIVTEFIFSGKAFEKIGKLLKDTKVKNHYDGAAVRQSGALAEYDELKSFKGEIFIGDYDFGNSEHETMNRSTGVKKAKQPSPIPEISSKNFEEMKKVRNDADLMAKRVIEQVWKQKI